MGAPSLSSPVERYPWTLGLQERRGGMAGTTLFPRGNSEGDPGQWRAAGSTMGARPGLLCSQGAAECYGLKPSAVPLLEP